MAKVFKPRLTQPASNNKYYMHYTKGGYNTATLVNGSSILPNCVGYCVGRWMEILGITTFDLGTNLRIAEEWYPYVNKKYKKGSTPKLGAVIVWQKGKIGKADGCGHVATVEKINADKSIVVSESGKTATGGYIFKTETIKYPYKRSGYTLEGFIYLPEEFVAEEPMFNVGQNYTCQAEMRVRTGPGINYATKTHAQLSDGGKKHDKDKDGMLDKGTVITCQQISTVNDEVWIKCPSGWVAGYFNKTRYLK